MASILWRRSDGSGADRCTVSRELSGYRIAGTAVFALDGVPYEIRYTVLTDTAWHTRTVGAHAQLPDTDRRLALNVGPDSTWSVGDDPIIDLFGATDVDMSFTPATNTLALNRLGLAVGESAEVVAAFIDFPAHDIRRASQHYERIDERTYRYQSGAVSYDLTVNEAGLVTEYPGEWFAVAVTP